MARQLVLPKPLRNFLKSLSDARDTKILCQTRNVYIALRLHLGCASHKLVYYVVDSIQNYYSSQ